MKPVIGLIPLVDENRESYWMLPGYMTGIQMAGGIPVMLPLEMNRMDIRQAANALDGVLFTGGHDVSPQMYGEAPLPECGAVCPARDRMEQMLFEECLEMDKPMLGICRGIQLINVLLGGTLYQDLPTQNPSDVNHHGAPPYDRPVHSISIVQGTPLHALCGPAASVNSYHHQAIRDLAASLTPMAYAEDGIIEAVYRKASRFLWAVQFHPEFAWHSDRNCYAIFETFVAACRSDADESGR
ncbi:MAG: gamma-glutamyl-gamma-aminobutyrate hydrolase family protein [Clostridia bacterium]|nr:gamma-glutamyl-gamma-aminobutyrate hydrolase family protein [Clostridia bacterium]